MNIRCAICLCASFFSTACSTKLDNEWLIKAAAHIAAEPGLVNEDTIKRKLLLSEEYTRTEDRRGTIFYESPTSAHITAVSVESTRAPQKGSRECRQEITIHPSKNECINASTIKNITGYDFQIMIETIHVLERYGSGYLKLGTQSTEFRVPNEHDLISSIIINDEERCVQKMTIRKVWTDWDAAP